jgi:hypothetical protein
VAHPAATAAHHQHEEQARNDPKAVGLQELQHDRTPQLHISCPPVGGYVLMIAPLAEARLKQD